MSARVAAKSLRPVFQTTFDNQLFSQESVFGAINGSGDLIPDYTRRAYYGYSANGLTVRTIQTAKASTTYANNAAVLVATRSQGADPAL